MHAYQEMVYHYAVNGLCANVKVKHSGQWQNVMDTHDDRTLVSPCDRELLGVDSDNLELRHVLRAAVQEHRAALRHV